MIDITKEEFWDNCKYEEITKKENIIGNFIKRHKLISGLLISLSLLMTVNTVLIYKFFTIFKSM